MSEDENITFKKDIKTSIRTCGYEEFEDTKWVIKIRKSKDRQHNGQAKNDKRTNNHLQNTTQKTKDKATLIPLTIGGDSAPGGISGPVI